MRVVVTGATGFVGQWLIKELIKQDNEVTVLVRDKNRLPCEWKEKVHVLECPLERLAILQEADFNDKKYDIFYHFAWAGTSGNERADVEKQLQNVKYSCDAVRLAARLSCKRFVNAGSIMEYEVMDFVANDGAKPGLGNIYSTAKLAGDFMAKTVATDCGLDYINIIISNIYGAGEYSARFLNTTLRKMLKNEAIPLTHGNQLYDFIYVTDAVKAILLAGEKGQENESFYIGNSIQYPLKEFIYKMKQVTGSDSELLFGKVPFNGALLSFSEFDTKKMEKLGFRPEISFEEGIKLLQQWIQEETET